jgi:hypothetical protein
MNELAQGSSVPAPQKYADVFVLSRLNSKWITGRWDRTLLRDVAFALLIALLIFGFFMRPSVDEIRMQFMTRQTTTGSIVDYHTYSCGRSNQSNCFEITYSYVVGNQRYTRTESVDQTTYNTYSRASRPTVTYALQDPTAAYIGATGHYLQGALIGAIVFLVLAVLFISPAISFWFKTRRYRRRGTLVYGRIQWGYGESERWGKGHRYILRISYEFASPTGKTISSSQVGQRSDLRNKPLPPLGTPCAVLYISDEDYLLL